MKVLIIEKKMSGTGTIHDLESDQYDRVIKFPEGHKYAVVLADYYSGNYTTHKSETAAGKQSYKMREYSHKIIDADGRTYTAIRDFDGYRLVEDR